MQQLFCLSSAAGFLLFGHFKVEGLAAVGALGCTVQQLVLFKHRGRAALRAGHFVLHGTVLGVIFAVLLFSWLYGPHGGMGLEEYGARVLVGSDKASAYTHAEDGDES